MAFGMTGNMPTFMERTANAARDAWTWGKTAVTGEVELPNGRSIAFPRGEALRNIGLAVADDFSPPVRRPAAFSNWNNAVSAFQAPMTGGMQGGYGGGKGGFGGNPPAAMNNGWGGGA